MVWPYSEEEWLKVDCQAVCYVLAGSSSLPSLLTECHRSVVGEKAVRAGSVLEALVTSKQDLRKIKLNRSYLIKELLRN